ncbi:hypothetical protein MIR68_009203 [Amoeboaphelidium protococcarum]|nr:hypothetical protein MIR68_009203 [Amoeboaphelidium protococcarum]
MSRCFIITLIAAILLLLSQNIKAEDSSCNLSAKPSDISECDYIIAQCPSDGAIDYLQLYFCQSRWNILTILLCLGILFITISVCASYFMTASIQSIQQLSRHLPHVVNRNGKGISDAVMGVTFLAFGNGVADVIGSFIGINSDASTLVLGELMGAGLFINTVVVGLIVLLHGPSIKLQQKAYLRDLIFFIFAVIFLLVVIADKRITLIEAICLTCYYACYVIVVTAGSQIWKFVQSLFGYGQQRGLVELTQNIHDDNRLIEEAGKLFYRGDDDEDQDDQVIGALNGQGTMNNGGRDSIIHDKYFYKFGAYGKAIGTYRLRPALSHYRSLSNDGDDLIEDFQQQKDGNFQKQGNSLLVEFDQLYDVDHTRHQIDVSDDRSDRRHTSFLPAESSSSQQQDDTRTIDSKFSERLLLSNSRDYNAQSGQGYDQALESRTISGFGRFLWRKLFPQNQKYGFSPPVERVLDVFLPVRYEWAELSVAGKFVSILAVVPLIMLTLCIPQPLPSLDDSRSDDYGGSDMYFLWDRWLLLIQIVCAPLFLFYTLGVTLFAAIPFIVVCFISIVVWTDPYKIPQSVILHTVVTFSCFFSSIVWIYQIANELMALLLALGVIMNISQGMIGLTIYAIGNSIADFVANLSVARQGYASMAIGACIGGPLFNILLGVGVSSLYYNISHSWYEIEINKTLIVSSCALLLSLMISVVAALSSSSQKWRTYGLTLIFIYATSMLINIVLEIVKH